MRRYIVFISLISVVFFGKVFSLFADAIQVENGYRQYSYSSGDEKISGLIALLVIISLIALVQIRARQKKNKERKK